MQRLRDSGLTSLASASGMWKCQLECRLGPDPGPEDGAGVTQASGMSAGLTAAAALNASLFKLSSMGAVYVLALCEASDVCLMPLW